MCPEIEIEIVGMESWDYCWRYDDSGIGEALDNGLVDACITYSHTRGVRNDHADFGYGILDINKAAGLLSLLESGNPKVDGNSDLTGLTVVDVGGWAPTP